MGSGSFLKVVAKNFDVLAGPVITLLYPLYASVKAIETKSPVDDQQWLTYWVLYSLITLFELTFAKVIEWLPFWSYMKLIFNCWLVLPYFNGAAYVYQNFVRPMFVKQVQETVNVWYVPRKKSIFTKPDDFLFAVEKFIEENGPEALQKLVNKAEKAPKPKKSSNKRVTFAEVEHETETTKSAKNDKHVIHHKKDTEQESSSWSSSSNFMIFSDENHYWT
ncbi:HVA22-like protein a isoform X1 [Ananas comosus]|uniref:HVA22-like protein n=1 Tax=Ananas comosus TaxID=4615 RepID=A0A6P5FX71_ANACO|nr:HVA22-like protein a isoform X1 [Ananas comosus]